MRNKYDYVIPFERDVKNGRGESHLVKGENQSYENQLKGEEKYWNHIKITEQKIGKGGKYPISLDLLQAAAKSINL